MDDVQIVLYTYLMIIPMIGLLMCCFSKNNDDSDSDSDSEYSDSDGDSENEGKME